MDLSSALGTIWDTALIKFVPFLFVLTVIVFFHELGHFLVGRLCGIKVLTFSVGFGPELLGFTDRHGTRWKLAAIPLGGYVKFLGDENAASMPDKDAIERMRPEERAQSFPAKSVGRRAATVAAGPIANFILAILIFAGVAFVNGRSVGDPVIAEVRAGTPAAAAGILPGDRIVSLDGSKVTYFSDIIEYVATRADTPIDVEVQRGGVPMHFTVTPRLVSQTDPFGNEAKTPQLGLVADKESASFRVEKLSALESLQFGASQTWFFTHHTVSTIAGFFTGKGDPEQIGGIIRIGGISGQVATLGFAAILLLTAQLSIGIGLLNLLPIPILDGGHLLYYACEVLRGKPLSEKAQELGFRIGIVLVMSLMLFAMWNDVNWAKWLT